MKFNIFDDSTWKLDEVDQQMALTNKALGSIGQLIGEIRVLKSKIEKTISANNNAEFLIAEQLKAKSPGAYSQMAIEYVYSDDEVKNIIQLIDQILLFWKDVENRARNWRELSPSLEKLKPFLKEDRYKVSDNINELTSIKVTGNYAWEAYLEMTLSYNNISESYNSLYRRYADAQDRAEYAR